MKYRTTEEENGKMAGLNNDGNKDPDALSDLFSLLTNVNLKCIRVSGTGFDSNTRYIYFYLRVELRGLLLSHNIWEFMYFRIPRGALDHILIATELKYSDPSLQSNIRDEMRVQKRVLPGVHSLFR